MNPDTTAADAKSGPNQLDASTPEEPLTAADLVGRIVADTGRDPEIAERMVRDYLDETSASLGVSVHQWGLDEGDLEEIRRGYEWIDYERGENPTTARERAADYAVGWADYAATIDRDHSPGHASRAHQEAVEWAERAQGFEPVDADVDELERARDAVAEVRQPDEPAVHHTEHHDGAGDADGWSS